MKKVDEIAQGKVFLVGAFVLAGTSVVAAKFVSGLIGVFTIASFSFAIALLLLVPICWNKLISALKTMSLLHLREVLVQALFGMFLFRFFLLNGLNRTSSLEAGILTGATPAITAFLAWAFLRERINWRTLCGILATICGVLLVQDVVKSGFALSSAHILGNLLVLGAAASESVFNILSRASATRLKENGTPLDPLVQTMLVTIFALLFCLIPAAFEHPIDRLGAIGWTGWLALGWYGIFVTALAYLCWYAGIKRSGAVTAAAFSGLMPLTSMILSTILLRERANVFQWLGGACVIAGMLLIVGRRQKTHRETRFHSL